MLISHSVINNLFPECLCVHVCVCVYKEHSLILRSRSTEFIHEVCHLRLSSFHANSVGMQDYATLSGNRFKYLVFEQTSFSTKLYTQAKTLFRRMELSSFISEEIAGSI